MTFSKNKHSNSVKCLIYKGKTAVFIPAVCIGDSFATNFELWLTRDYYQATMETYQLAKAFLQNNQEYQHLCQPRNLPFSSNLHL